LIDIGGNGGYILDYVRELNQVWDKPKLARIGVAYVLRASLSKEEMFVCITLVGVLPARFCNIPSSGMTPMMYHR